MVEQNNLNTHDFSVGIVASSRHQGFWNHHPNLNLEPSTTNFAGIEQQIGIGTNRLQRRPIQQQFTGHTAVMCRLTGIVEFVSGFVPNIATLPRLVIGGTGGGHWQDDQSMLRDPTCISFEIPVEPNDALDFHAWFDRNKISIVNYNLRTSDALRSFNCVIAASTVLIDYLSPRNRYQDYVQQLLGIQNSRQGDLIRHILGGFQ